MKPRIALKTLIDAMMLILYIQLVFCYDSNELYHEIAGISIGVLAITHISLNLKETASLFRKSSKQNAKLGNRIQFGLDIALMITMAITVVLGLLIAKHLYAGLFGGVVSEIHQLTAYVGMAIIVAHLAQHAKYLVAILKPKKKKVASRQRQQSATAYSRLDDKRYNHRAVYSRRDFVTTSLFVTTGIFLLASTAALRIPAHLEKLDETEEESTEASESSSETATNDTYDYDYSSDTSDDYSSSSDYSSNYNDYEYDDDSNYDQADSSYSGSSNYSSDTSSNSSNASQTVCTLCKKRCSINNLKCRKGEQWASQNGYA